MFISSGYYYLQFWGIASTATAVWMTVVSAKHQRRSDTSRRQRAMSQSKLTATERGKTSLADIGVIRRVSDTRQTFRDLSHASVAWTDTRPPMNGLIVYYGECFFVLLLFRTAAVFNCLIVWLWVKQCMSGSVYPNRFPYPNPNLNQTLNLPKL